MDAALTGGDVGPFNTPKLASRLTASIEVTAEMANGEIGFTDMLPAAVTEPEGGRRTTQVTSDVCSQRVPARLIIIIIIIIIIDLYSA